MIDKAPDAYRTISEVGEDLDLPQHVLRFWETRFSQIRPLKRGGGRRYYRPDDVELLKGIRHLLYAEGYTIKGVQRILKEQGPKAVQALAQDRDGGPPARIAIATADDETGLEAYDDMEEAAPPPAPLGTPPARAPAPERADGVPHWLARPAPPAAAPMPAAAPPPPAQAPATADLFAVEPTLAAVRPPAPPAAPPPRPAPNVSYTRGGLKPVIPAAPPPAPPPPEPGVLVRKPRLPLPVEPVVADLPYHGDEPAFVEEREPPRGPGLSEDGRRALQSALFELSECRRAIERVMAARAH